MIPVSVELFKTLVARGWLTLDGEITEKGWAEAGALFARNLEETGYLNCLPRDEP